MEDKITIIEGPPPVFEPVDDGWALGLNEGPTFNITAMTRLRTFNGAALVERCHRAWRNSLTINLHYRSEIGLEQQAPIVAARFVETEDGQVLLLWLQLSRDDFELEFDAGDDSAEDDLDTLD